MFITTRVFKCGEYTTIKIELSAEEKAFVEYNFVQMTIGKILYVSENTQTP